MLKLSVFVRLLKPCSFSFFETFIAGSSRAAWPKKP